MKTKRFIAGVTATLAILALLIACSNPVSSGSSSATTASTTTTGTTTSTTTSTPTSNYVYFVSQANGTTTASLSGGTIAVSSTYSSSGNGFKYVSPNYYGTTSNGFISFPTAMSGDFSISATIVVTAQNKASNASGIGLGVTTGFNGTDSYAYALARNSSNVINGYYVSGAGAVSAGSPSVAFTNNTAFQLTFSRVGTNFTYGGGTVGSPTTNTAATSYFTNGTTVYGNGSVYPCISFNNVNATITNLIVKDASGTTVFDSSTGSIVTYVPASLTLSSTAISVTKGLSTSLTATALAAGGTVSGVTATIADSSIASFSISNGSSNSTISLTGLKGGTTTLTVVNSGDSSSTTNTKTVTITVNDYQTADSYGTITSYPAIGSTSAYTDGELSLTFDSAPTLNTGGSIKIYKVSDGIQADSINFASETQTINGTTVTVGSQLARVSGSTVYFTPHFGALSYGTAYYVVIPTTAITGTLNGVTFTGFSNLNTVATWHFTTQSKPTIGTTISVDGSQSSTSNFRSVGGALMYLAANPISGATAVTINVAAGTYTELLYYKPTTANLALTITIAGPSGNSLGSTCVIQYLNGNSINGTTQTRPTFYFTGANLVLQNLTLKNTGTRTAVAQAETLYFASGSGSTLAAYNSSFYSKQDTLQTSGRNWFYSCYIEGNVDFIWGTADAALFQNCQLHVIDDAVQTYSIFVARTGTTGATTVGKGYVLVNSTVSVDASATITYARNAGGSGFYDQVTLINNTFSGSGTIGTGLWVVTTTPLSLGDATYVGWKAAGNTGLSADSITTATGTASTINSQSTHWATRDEILNEVVTVTSGTPSGYQTASSTWDTSTLASTWGASSSF